MDRGRAERLGRVGEVADEDLGAVVAGLVPGSGGLTPDVATVRIRARRVPGCDLGSMAAESVGVRYAVSDVLRVRGSRSGRTRTAPRL